MIFAILRAQLLSMRMGARRGATFSFITGLIWYGFWSFLAFLIEALTVQSDAAALRSWIPAGLLLVCLYWQLVPIVSTSMGSGLDMRKLLVYPVPHRKLFIVETALRLATAFEMVLILTGGMVGLVRNPDFGGFGAAPRILALLSIYVLFNLLLASGLRSLLERLLSRRRLREMLVFLLLIGLTVPRLLFETGVEVGGFHRFDVLLRLTVLPWAAVGAAILGGSVWLAVAVVSAWTVAAAWFGRSQFDRNLRYDAVAAQAAPLDPEPVRADSWSERFFRLPSLLFRDPLAGIIEKELRSLSRTPRFRMVFVMGFSFGVMVWLPLILGRDADRQGVLEQNFLVVVSVYALTLLGQVTYWNGFGFDRSAVQFYFAAPAPISKTLLGKNLASLIFIYLEVAILIVITLVLRVGIGVSQIIEAVVVVGVCALYMMGFGNISSVQYPRPLTPERVSQGGALSRFQALVFVLYPIALMPVFLAYLARYAFNSETAFALILAFAAVLGGFLYWLGMESAVKGIATGRERILTDLSRGEGPVASS
jgi:ABC-2 type transport system permease protein